MGSSPVPAGAFVDDYHDALYLTRGTDNAGQLLNGVHPRPLATPRNDSPA